MDSYIGKLRSIFSDFGRQGDWNRTLLLGNPAASLKVKQYLKEVTAEQLQARITPKQATPLFLDKLLLLSRHLEKRLLLPSLTPSEIFITARDQAFFKTLFFSGVRGRDLGQVKTSEIARFPDDNVFFYLITSGERLLEMDPQTSLVCAGTPTLLYAQLGQLRLTWPSRVNWVSFAPTDTYFALQTSRAMWSTSHF